MAKRINPAELYLVGIFSANLYQVYPTKGKRKSWGSSINNSSKESHFLVFGRKC
jgi:hypothetical protein